MGKNIALFLVFISILGLEQSSAQYKVTEPVSFLTASGHSFDMPPRLKDSGEVHSPKKATIMSAIIPGLGQMYNEKYWKTGLIYVSAGVLGYLYKFNKDSLDSYQDALDVRIDGDPNTVDTKYPGLLDGKIISERDFYRNNRDRVIIGFVALYALQIIDANVDAHLREFDLNEDLALSVDPDLFYDPRTGFQSGLSLRLRF